MNLFIRYNSTPIERHWNEIKYLHGILYISSLCKRSIDENQQAFKDPLHVLVGLITKARSKKIKEALNGLIQDIWVDSNAGHSKLDPKEDEGLINLIQAIEG